MGKQPKHVAGSIRLEGPMEERQIRALLEDERTRLQGLREGLSDAAQPVEAETAADPAAGGHLADAGSEMFERSRDLSIVEDVDAQLADIEHAKARLSNGTYGTCEA